MKRLVLAALLVLFLGWTVLSAVTQVEPGERAVVRRFGRILDYKPGPGLFIGLPWGCDRVERVAVGQVRRVAVGLDIGPATEEDRLTPPGQLLTGDHNLVNIQAEVNYAVVEDEVVKFVLHKDRVDALVARAAETALAEWIAGRDVFEALRRGKAVLPGYLVQAVQSRIAPYDLGVRIEQASVNRLYPPEEVKDAFDRLAQAETTTSTQRNQAEQEANRKLSEAAGEVFRIRSLASAYVREQRLQAQADAETFLRRWEQYRKLVRQDPHYLNALWQDEMTRLYNRMRESGRIDVLDSFLTGEGLNITQFPLMQKKK
ncbi:MAG: protease modulator HflK [Gemmataceae bacterium]|nr:protease modulator HflK [Gemmataceae bacterium]MCI0738445.1 protease modulator HflK [Gemmataceae bacterium]